MKPIEFPEHNVVYAKDQPEYLPLPVHKKDDGEVVSCWQLSEEEKQHVMKTGKIWLSVFTFNKPLQPLLPSVYKLVGETTIKESTLRALETTMNKIKDSPEKSSEFLKNAGILDENGELSEPYKNKEE